MGCNYCHIFCLGGIFFASIEDPIDMYPVFFAL